MYKPLFLLSILVPDFSPFSSNNFQTVNNRWIGFFVKPQDFLKSQMILLLTGLLVISSTINAQLFPGFGIISNEEKLIKECPFDQEAEAVYLLHEAVSNYNDDYNLVTDHHIRLKILKEKGIRYADIIIPYFSDNNFESITDVDGLVISYDEKGFRTELKLDKKSVYSKKVTKYHSEVRFALPSVKVGSIIDFKYRSTMRHYGGLEDWNFQEELPVMRSTYLLSIIPNYEFSYLVHKSPLYQAEVKSDANSGQVYFAMNNIPGLGSEPYMDARKDYLQRVTFKLSGYNNTSSGGGFSSPGSNKTKYSASWQQIIQEMLIENSFGGQLNKNLDGTDDFIKQVKYNSDDAQKIKLVFNYVSNNMSWNYIHSKVSPDGIKGAWSKKSGTNGEINLILINLLKAAGLDAHPLLVSERQNGKVNKDYPSVDQFNTVYAFVTANNKKYYLNANDRVTPTGIIPVDILNTTALLVNRKSGELISINDESLQYKDYINISASVTEEGKLKGNVYMSSKDYARVERLKKYRQDKEKYIDENFHKYIPGVLIDSFALQNEQDDSLMLIHKFTFQSALQQTGGYMFLPANLFTGFETNPFVATNRFSNINFGYKQSVSLNAIIQVPPGLVIDALPKPLKMVNEDNTITVTRQIINDEANNKLLVRINIDMKKSLYTVDEYEPLKEIYKKMFVLLNEQIVFKKN
ncbi:MAG: DUF3857 domain-containing protein [Chitinophagaceae bacterium]